MNQEQRTQKKFTLGFSPCPNDTFMFDAMVHHKTDTEGLEFEVVMEDVETLNLMALKGELDISKVSFAAFTRMTETYQLLNAGSALGKGVGPLVVGLKSDLGLKEGKLKIAVPGINTTANFLFSVFFPEAKNKTQMIFSDIESAVLSGKADAGVIIHENRFTYEQKGLKKICDLGELWEQETGQAIPLGGIVTRRNFSAETRHVIGRIIRRSVQYAFANPQSGYEYIKQHAQEMSDDVRRRHIETYVNNFSVDLGAEGRTAIQILFQKARDSGMIAFIPDDLFAETAAESFTG
jgi:1,4-dihydroxy-6-naphthoate synthase